MRCRPIRFGLVWRKEIFVGNSLYSTKAKFCDRGKLHDILISCSGENGNLDLSVIVDERLVVSVKRLEWNFRGNQTIYLDGLVIDLMWDVHNWLHNGEKSGAAVFMFRTRGMGSSSLWLEENLWQKDEEEDDLGFSLAIYAYRNTS